MRLRDLKLSEENPRYLNAEEFRKLIRSLRDFPQMLELRPIVVDENLTILGGNMRARALREIYPNPNHKIPPEWVKVASGLTEAQKREFLIKDNSHFGRWDFDILANEWNAEEIKDWGVEFPFYPIEENVEDVPRETEEEEMVADDKTKLSVSFCSARWEKMGMEEIVEREGDNIGNYILSAIYSYELKV